MLSTFAFDLTSEDLASYDLRAEGLTDAMEGDAPNPCYTYNSAYTEGYNQGIRDRIEAAKRELDFAAFFSDADEF